MSERNYELHRSPAEPRDQTKSSTIFGLILMLVMVAAVLWGSQWP